MFEACFSGFVVKMIISSSIPNDPSASEMPRIISPLFWTCFE